MGRVRNSVADFHSEISSPVLAIREMDERGMLFESKRSFEPGCALELGFHVVPKDSAGAAPKSEFVTCEGVVAASNLCAAENGLPVYEVVVLFNPVMSQGRALRRFARAGLQLVNRLRSAHPRQPSTAGLSSVGLN